MASFDAGSSGGGKRPGKRRKTSDDDDSGGGCGGGDASSQKHALEAFLLSPAAATEQYDDDGSTGGGGDGGIKLLSEMEVYAVLSAHVPNVHAMQDRAKANWVGTLIAITYERGIPQFASNPSVQQHTIKAIRYIFHAVTTNGGDGGDGTADITWPCPTCTLTNPMARRSSAEHLIATKALRLHSFRKLRPGFLIVVESFAKF